MPLLKNCETAVFCKISPLVMGRECASVEVRCSPEFLLNVSVFNHFVLGNTKIPEIQS